jgi:hypothetical protein
LTQIIQVFLSITCTFFRTTILTVTPICEERDRRKGRPATTARATHVTDALARARRLPAFAS